MRNDEREIAALLLQSKAIKLNPAKPFQWASGWKSPVYCDNRITLSHPEIRTVIKNRLIALLKEKFSDAEAVAGVATGAIAQGALVADALNLPFLYVRSSQKSHGLENLVEGDPRRGERVVVVEDLISTGSSSLKAVKALEEKGCKVLGMMAVFTYDFETALNSFQNAGITLFTLTDYRTLIETAVETGYLQPQQIQILNKWREAPQDWGRP